MFFDCESVSHPCDVIANGSFQAAPGDPFLDVTGQDEWLVAVIFEQVRNDILGFHLHSHDPVVMVKLVK